MKILNKIKNNIKTFNIFWDLKYILVAYPLFTIFIGFQSYNMLDVSSFSWWIIPLLFFIAPIILFIIHWFKVVKPIVEKVNKEIELEEKYKWIYDRMTKREE